MAKNCHNSKQNANRKNKDIFKAEGNKLNS